MTAAEYWFTVEAEVLVLAPGEAADPIGRLVPGRRYRAIGESDGRLRVPGPNGAVGVVPAEVASAIHPPSRGPGTPLVDSAAPPDAGRAPRWALVASVVIGLMVTVAGVALGAPIDEPAVASTVQGAPSDSSSSSGSPLPTGGSDSDGVLEESVDPALVTPGTAEAPAGWVLVAFEPFEGNAGASYEGESVSEEFGTARWAVRNGALELTLEPAPNTVFNPNRSTQIRKSLQQTFFSPGESIYVAAVVTESPASGQAVSICSMFFTIAGTRYTVNVNARAIDDRPVVSVNAQRPGDQGFGESLTGLIDLSSAVDGANRVAVLKEADRMTVMVNGDVVATGIELPAGTVDRVGVSGILSGPAACSWDDFEVRMPPAVGSGG